MLELSEVCKSFGAVRAVRPLSLTLLPGRTLAVIGPSGSGKSTLLRMMIGLVRPDSGSVRVEGRILDASNAETSGELRLRMGYVIQDGGLFPHLTARKNISLQASYLRWPSRRIDERIAELAALTRMPAAALDRYPVELSGGQRQRVSLMRALMPDPDFLLLDEPLGALDPLVRSDLQQDLRAIFEKIGKTVAMVTHDLAEAAYFAERILLMHEGRVVQEGTFAELSSAPAEPFVSRFFNSQRVLPAATREPPDPGSPEEGAS